MRTLRFAVYHVVYAAVLTQSWSFARADTRIDDDRLEELVYTCVEAQVAPGNADVHAPDRTIDSHTLVVAGLSYLPDGFEISVSLRTGNRDMLDGPWGYCTFRKSDYALAAVTCSFGASHAERRLYIPSPPDKMSEPEIAAYLARRDRMTAQFDLRDVV